MFARKIGSAVVGSALMVAALAGAVSSADAQARDRIRVPVGRAEVVTSNDEVRTVAIAEPKIADAAVGSARTVVVNGKAPGITTLVVYSEGARYKVYDIEVFTPNGNRQVQLRVRMAEVTDNASRELGFDWFGRGHSNAPWLDGTLTGGILTSKISPYTDDPPGLTVGPNTDGFLGYFRNGDNLTLEVTWKALEEKGDLRTLASPTLVTRSGMPASFLAGGEIPVPIASGAGTGGSQTVTIEWKEFGVKLDFTPTVEEDNSITLKVAPEMSQLDFTSGTQGTFTIPALSTRKASTVVNLRAGEHLAIGGLKSTEKTKVVRKVPILGHIPLLGFFFTNTVTGRVERDLLVVVSPELLEQAETTLPALPTDRSER